MSELRISERVVARVGDITREAVDAVVNAANSALLGGGGVDGAIHRAGGPEILAACRRIRETTHPKGLPPGEAVITTAGRLPARFVIHTVGPIYGEHGGEEPRLLAACYRSSLALAASHGLATIAFPAISTGIFGFPIERAAPIAIQAARTAAAGTDTVRDVRFVLFSPGDLAVFQQAVDALGA